MLVTGGAERLGAAMARRFHAAGADVVVHYHRSQHAATEFTDALNRLRAGSASIVCADLNDVDALPGLAAAAVERHGRLDVLVNNASTFYPTPVGAITATQFEDLIGTNLRAPLFLSQAAAVTAACSTTVTTGTGAGSSAAACRVRAEKVAP